jgi:hypothetical protein
LLDKTVHRKDIIRKTSKGLTLTDKLTTEEQLTQSDLEKQKRALIFSPHSIGFVCLLSESYFENHYSFGNFKLYKIGLKWIVGNWSIIVSFKVSWGIYWSCLDRIEDFTVVVSIQFQGYLSPLASWSSFM